MGTMMPGLSDGLRHYCGTPRLPVLTVNALTQVQIVRSHNVVKGLCKTWRKRKMILRLCFNSSLCRAAQRGLTQTASGVFFFQILRTNLSVMNCSTDKAVNGGDCFFSGTAHLCPS